MLAPIDRAAPPPPPPPPQPSITTQAAVLIARHQANGRPDPVGLAADVAAIRTAGETDRSRDLANAIQPQLTPVERGQFLSQLESGAPPAADGPSRGEVIADLTQIGLDIAGIVDPTPISDGSNAVISLFRGDFGGAAISAVGIVPYLGDAAKLGKLGHWAETVTKAAELAKTDSRFADMARPALSKIKGALDKVDIDGLPLPQFAKDHLRSMSKGLDEALAPAARAESRIAVRTFDNAADFNRAANGAAPNTRYEFGDYRYTTDQVGRPSIAEGRINLTPTGRNDPALQREIGQAGRNTDIGFHVIADRFGGQTNRLNVVAGNGRPIGDGLPNLNQGAYKRFENTVANLAEQGRNVEIRVETRYNASNATTRPDEFVASYRVDGGRWRMQTFDNK